MTRRSTTRRLIRQHPDEAATAASQTPGFTTFRPSATSPGADLRETCVACLRKTAYGVRTTVRALSPGERRKRYRVATGTVKWFNDDKGFGFIAPEDGAKDVFVHHSNIAGTGFSSLAEGAKVEFETQQGQKGLEATDVRVV